jgi:DNA helicase HerA-like ATPase
MLPAISNKRCAIFGLQGSGKTELSKVLAKSIRAHFVYDVHHEYNGFNRYLVEYKRVDARNKNDLGIAELNNVVDRIVLASGQIRLFVLDEANRFCPNHYPLPASILVLNDDNRHDRIGFIAIARRPAQLNTDLTELAHYLFIFNLAGRNDYNFLEDTAIGLGDAVRKLKPFHFVIVHPDRHYEIHIPIKPSS